MRVCDSVPIELASVSLQLFFVGHQGYEMGRIYSQGLAGVWNPREVCVRAPFLGINLPPMTPTCYITHTHFLVGDAIFNTVSLVFVLLFFLTMIIYCTLTAELFLYGL